MSDTTIKQNYITINGWSITSPADPYIPPEMLPISIHGAVTGHPHFDDGAKITTSRIVEANGRIVMTQSGSTYILGDVDPGYLAYLPTIGRVYNPDAPVKVI
jgi:hypothetical protein